MTHGQTVPFSDKHWSLKLPREHGAVIVFSFSCIVSLLLCTSDFGKVACSQLILWTMLLSLHQPKQLMVLTAMGALFLYFTAGCSAALWVVVVFSGIQVINSSTAQSSQWWKEAFGLAGAALSPLPISCLLSGNLVGHLLVAQAFLAAIMTGACLIRACRSESMVTPLPTAFLSLFFWLCLLKNDPVLTAFCLAPYAAQAIWLATRAKPSYKQLGIAQAICLFSVAATLIYFCAGNA